jgi:hypothetical protein
LEQRKWYSTDIKADTDIHLTTRSQNTTTDSGGSTGGSRGKKKELGRKKKGRTASVNHMYTPH